MKPAIIFDVDGVLLNWVSMLPFFLKKNGLPVQAGLNVMGFHGHTCASEIFSTNGNLEEAKNWLNGYNTSEFGAMLSGYNDAIGLLPILKEKYDLLAVTCFGSSAQAFKNRFNNLDTLYPGCFEPKNLYCIEPGASKINTFKYLLDKHNVAYIVDDQKKCIDEAVTALMDVCGCSLDDTNRVVVHMNRYDNPNNCGYSNLASVFKPVVMSIIRGMNAKKIIQN